MRNQRSLSKAIHAGIALIACAAISPITANLASAQEGKRGGTLVVATSQSPRHLNSAVQSGIATGMPSTQIFASLLRYDGNWNPQPYLARSWSFSPDGRSLTVRLRDDARFHDGEPITSEDVAFSLMTVKEHHPFKSMFAPLERVDTPDEHTAILRLDREHPALLLALSGALSPIIPKHVYDDGQNMKAHPANSAPVGSGPFKFEQFVPGEQVVLTRNDDFFLEGKPYLDRIVYRIIKDPAALIFSLENGQADMYPFMSTSQEISRLTNAPDVNVTSEGYAAIGPINWLAFNTAREPLNNLDVRRAIAYAVDRDFITRVLHRGVSTVQRSPIIESSPFFNPDIETYDADLDTANRLLDEAGYPRNSRGTRFDLTVDYIPGPAEQQQTVAEYLKSRLKRIGIEVTVRAAPDFPTWAKRISNGDFDLTMDVVFNWGDPVIGVHRTYLSDNIVPGVIWTNTQSYRNAEVDELLAQAAVETSQERRKELYDEFQRIVADELPVYWINALPYHTAYRDNVSNPPVSIWGSMQSMDEVYFNDR